jgi:beta-mannosidase
MNQKYLTYFLLFLSVCGISQLKYQGRMMYAENWKFREVGTTKYYSAQIPGTIHTDLIHHHLIPDPNRETNEEHVQWVEEKDWEYVTLFECFPNEIAYKHIELEFEGLDTYAKVFLNGKEILQADNMFLDYEIDIKKYLKKGINELKVIFESAVKHGRAEAKKLPYTLPGDEKVFTRKAQYQYGWDFGPRLVTCGIYKPVYLKYWNDYKIISLYHQIKNISDTLAEVNIISEIICEKSSTINAKISVGETDEDTHYGKTADFKIQLKKGINIDTFTYQIPNPKLWYCSGQGQQPMYACKFELHKKGFAVADDNFKFALRTIELVKERDFFGESFYFKVNGKPVFMKGANVIPSHNFMTSLYDTRFLAFNARFSNMNMLRVWGGGLYLDDNFYYWCDRAGILVWQDFMFACSMYPGDEHFLQSVKLEAEQQVKRLRNHPCIALWCGNNEVDEGWHNWGWQKQYNYTKTDSAKIWNDYQKLFHSILPDVVKKYDSKTPYVSSSPMLGWGKKESLQRGDSHYWGVWWGMEPFEIYEKKVGRFMSEYGFQGMPSYSTLKKYGDSLDLNSSYIKAHQKHPTGYQTVNTYMERDYKVPKDFFKYVHTSQLLQRDGMQIAIEAHRRNKPYCMGTLYWQLNDCWPATSWSAIDYEGRPKILYYATKKLYANFCISTNRVRGQYNIYVISDSTKDIDATLEIKLKTTKGQILLNKTKNISVKENSSEIFESFSEEELKLFNKNECYLSCNLIMNEKIIAHKNYFFVKPKDIVLNKPNISITQTGHIMKIKSDVFVKDFYLFYSDQLIYHDNCFDIEPDKQIEINLGVELKEQIQYISLYDINH